jgi:hypothetical protein
VWRTCAMAFHARLLDSVYSKMFSVISDIPVATFLI